MIEQIKVKLRRNLLDMIKEKNTMSAYKLANWCSDYLSLHHNEEIELDPKLYVILNDIDAQWELYVANTYPIEELDNMDFSKVRLPIDWCYKWLEQLDEVEEMTQNGAV